MEDGQLILAAGSLLTAGLLASLLAVRVRVPSLVLFLGVGMVIGVLFIDFDDYDLARKVPITFETLFKPGARPRDVLDPIVARAVENRGGPGALTLDDLGAEAYENFAITDDAVTFFFDQDGLLSHVDGPLTVKVPRTELAALLA